jgi:zinc transport system ATP-binding protein
VSNVRPNNAVEYADVSFTYPAAERPALEGVSLGVREGERLGVLGPNGGGKSTLLKLTLGLLQGYRGEIRVFGHTPQEARRRHLVGYVPQRVEAELRFPLSVEQVVTMAAAVGVSPLRPIPRETVDSVRSALRQVGVDELRDRVVGELSGGQLQLVMIARAIAHAPRGLILDEPMVGVDVAGQQQFAELLNRLHEHLKLTTIIVSHDIRTIAAGCDRVACLSRTLHSHTAPQGLTPSVLAEVFRHDVAAIFGDVHVDAHTAAGCTHEHHHHGGAVGLSVRGKSPQE